MPDPKLQRLADLLRANYVPAGQRQPVVAAPLPPVAQPMDPAAYRVDRFVRRAALTPAMQRQLMQAQALRAGARPPSGEEIPQ